MIAPSAMMIEIARDRLKDGSYSVVNRVMLERQTLEAKAAVPNEAAEFYFGYQLGMETARVMLEGMPAAVFNQVKI